MHNKMEMKKYLIGMTLIAATMLTTACRDSRRNEIEQRREALKHKQDSTLQAAQQELAIVDSTLEAVKAEYEQKKKEVEAHKAALKATEEELTALTLLRLHRDSLQVQWNVLGAKIKYIRQKQKDTD
jgi:peptidoglycan hydrolase CwlO-like protein